MCGCSNYEPVELADVVENYLESGRPIASFLDEDKWLVDAEAAYLNLEGIKTIEDVEREYGREAVVQVVKSTWNNELDYRDEPPKFPEVTWPPTLTKPEEPGPTMDELLSGIKKRDEVTA